MQCDMCEATQWEGAVPDSLLQNAFGGEVKGSCNSTRGCDPVTQHLARSILIIVHGVAIPPATCNSCHTITYLCGNLIEQNQQQIVLYCVKCCGTYTYNYLVLVSVDVHGDAKLKA